MKKILLLALMLVLLPSVLGATIVPMSNYTPSAWAIASTTTDPANEYLSTSSQAFFIVGYTVDNTSCTTNIPQGFYSSVPLSNASLLMDIPISASTVSNVSIRPFLIKPGQTFFLGKDQASADACRANTGFTYPVNYINSTIGIRATRGYTGSGYTSAYSYLGVSLLRFAVLSGNDIAIYYYKESDGSYIGGEPINTTLTGLTSGISRSNQSANDGFLLMNTTADTYEAIFSAVNYSTRKYVITASNSSASTTNVYLLPSGSPTTTVTVIDAADGTSLQNVYVTQERSINGSWTLVSSCYTDIAGSCQLAYQASVAYRLGYTKGGYGSLTYLINPITQSTYTVRLTSSINQTYNQDYAGVSLLYNPATFRKAANSWTLTVASPQGLLSSYSYSLQNAYNMTIDANGSGTNSYGETFIKTINYTDVPVGSQVYLNFTYTNTDNDTNSYTYILNVGNYSGTLIDQTDNLFGLSLFDRLLIATVMIVLIAGIAFMFAGFEAASVTAIFIMGYLMVTGFINIYVGALVIIPIFFVLVWRAQI